MTIYRGRRIGYEVAWVVRIRDGKRRRLPLRLAQCNHSPAGFEWGYQGSGPAQLAFALLADRLPDCIGVALELHQGFKRDVVANLASPEWVIDGREIDEWIWAQSDGAEYVLAEADEPIRLVQR